MSDEKFPFENMIGQEIKNPQEAEKPNEPKPEEQQKIKRTPIELDKHGLLVPRTMADEIRVAEAYLVSKMAPRQFDTPAKVFIGLQYCKELGLRPIVGLRQVALINGTPSIWGELPITLAKQTGKLKKIIERIFTKDYTEINLFNKNLDAIPYIAVCNIETTEGNYERAFTWDDAKKAGLLDKKESIWLKYPKRMLQMRARGWALKDAIPEAYMGAAILEYDYDATVDSRGNVLGEVKDVTQALNNTYLKNPDDSDKQAEEIQVGSHPDEKNKIENENKSNT